MRNYNEGTMPHDPVLPGLQRVGSVEYSCGGLTKREYFAAQAMQAMISKNDLPFGDCRFTAYEAVKYADALIKTLNEVKS